MIYRKRFIENGQLWVGFTRDHPQLNMRRIVEAKCIVAFSQNNWMRRIFYAAGLSRRYTRMV